MASTRFGMVNLYIKRGSPLPPGMISSPPPPSTALCVSPLPPNIVMISSPLPSSSVTSSSPALPNTVDPTIIEQEPDCIFEFRFTHKYERWIRNSSGDPVLIESFPTASPSSYWFKISRSPTLYSNFLSFLEGFLSQFDTTRPLLLHSAHKIASHIVSLINERVFEGFYALVEIETSNQVFDDEEQMQNVSTATADAAASAAAPGFHNEEQIQNASTATVDAAAAATQDRDLEVPASREESIYLITRLKKLEGISHDSNRGQSREISGDCVICLEELSSSINNLIKLGCDHMFHELCISKWLKNHKNSCPICRSQVF